jgi:hypothetical protein
VGKKTPGLRVDVDDDSTGRAFALVELLVLERVQNALSLLAQAFTKAHKRGVRRSTGKHKKRRNREKVEQRCTPRPSVQPIFFIICSAIERPPPLLALVGVGVGAGLSNDGGGGM